MDFRWSLSNQKIIYGIVILLLLTKSWSLPAVTLGLPVFIISGFTILLLAIITSSLWFKKQFILLLVILIVAPILNMGLHGKFDLSRFLLNILLFLTALFGFQIVRKLRIENIGRLLKLGIIFNIIFGVVSILNPNFFTPYAELTSSLNFYFGRAYGFFLQPNAFAYGLLINIILLYGLTQHSDKKPSKVYLYLGILLIILSGSRIGIAFSILFLAYFNYMFFNLKNVTILIAGVITSIIILSSLIIELQLEETLTRLESIRSGSISTDNSLNDRLEYQIKYLEVIKNKPFFGYGFGSTPKLKETGVIIDVAHQTHLDQLLEGGIFQYLLFIIFLLWLGMKMFVRKLGLLRILPVMFLIYSFFSSTLMTERVTFLAIGILIYYENSHSNSWNEWRRC